MIDWSNLLHTFNPIHILVMGTVGLFVGAQVIRHWAIYPGHVLGFLLTMGTAFNITLIVARTDEASIYRADAVAELFLWWVFCATMGIGYWSTRPRSRWP